MNRRSFFKVVTGFVAGIFLPKVKPKALTDKEISRMCNTIDTPSI